MRCGCIPVALFLYLTAVTPHPHTNLRSAPAHSKFSSQHLREEQLHYVCKSKSNKAPD